MFGNNSSNSNISSSNGDTDSASASATGTEPATSQTSSSTTVPPVTGPVPSGPVCGPVKVPTPPPTTSSKPERPERKSRRISSNTVSAFMASARNSLSHNNSHDDGNSKKQQPAPKSPKMSKDADTDTNNSAGRSKPTSKCTFRVGVSEDKNKRCRRTMEDTHAYLYNFLPTNVPARTLSCGLNSCDSDSKNLSYSTLEENSHGESDNGYFAIFDGHAGTFAAEWCGKKLHHLLEDNIRQNPQKSIPEILDMTFTNVDKEFQDLPVKNSGCTAVCAVLRWEERSANGDAATSPGGKKVKDAKHAETELQKTRMLYTANVGDARIVLCRGGKALRLSYDHKGSDENEGKRVSNAGGLILNNRVNVTRALGDSYIKELVTGHPYTTETVIEPDLDEFLILACDGLWDVCSDQEAVDHVRGVQDPQEASRMLVEHALARFSTDNLSCMVVRLDQAKTGPSKQEDSVGLGIVDQKAAADNAILEAEDAYMEDGSNIISNESAKSAAEGAGNAGSVVKDHAETAMEKERIAKAGSESAVGYHPKK